MQFILELSNVLKIKDFELYDRSFLPKKAIVKLLFNQ